MALGSKTSRGIYLYGEDDTEASFSALLNKGMESVHDAARCFAGTPVQRAALNPAPDGATWQDTNSEARRWVGIGGGWSQIAGPLRKTAMSTAGGMNSGWSGVAGHPIEIESDGIYARMSGRLANSGFAGSWGKPWTTLVIPPGFRPAAEMMIPLATGVSANRDLRLWPLGTVELWGEAANAAQWNLQAQWRIAG